MRFRVLATVAVGGAIALALQPVPVDACASVGRRGPVTIAGEEALVVYDEAAGMQHFVRTAAFEDAPRDFGFLVPTPGRPELTEVDSDVFERLFHVYFRRDRQRRTRAAGGSSGSSMSSGVEVVARQVVAGLDATVLRASDAGALERWLAEHGYPSGDALTGWLERYVVKGWHVTAFKLTPGNRRDFETRAVRMSFATPKPYFPYAEPQHAGRRPRPFRVDVVAPWRADAQVGLRPWAGRVGYAGQPGESLRRALAGVVPSESFRDDAWLTVLDEPRSTRPNQDLFFVPAEEQAAVASTIRRRLEVRVARPPVLNDFPF
ncbi:MAG: DUF2330 domain-containing protein [Sandaracinus sp.]|nr:DUF2330 domain-containing protein [Sandaracinus sp.]MCB9616519.1 DUF2330 domain-containing protein [Sandaracinus sp.]MCB9635836.1 DUF2330 domain-containing protein [Sandaracinus sp.]